MEAHTLKYKLPMLYCNTIGAQTEIVFDGGSLVYDINGKMVKEMNYFSEDYALFDLNELSTRKKSPEKIAERHYQKAEGGNFPLTETKVSEGSVSQKYYYSASEVGRDLDTIEYLTEEKNISAGNSRQPVLYKRYRSTSVALH